VLKAVIFHIAANGIRILAFDEESIWIGHDDPTGKQVRDMSEALLKRTFDHDFCNCIVSSSGDF